MKFWTFILAAVLTLGSVSAEAAKRLGGGRSFGKQSDNVTQREATPKPPANAGAQAPNAGAAGAAAPARKPWGAMLGGIAAGLGLAWLASSLGFGEELAQFMMFALLALAIMAAVGWFMRSRRGAGSSSSAKGPYAFQSANEARPSTYNPENIGNDASARPWERASMAFQASTKSQQGGFSGIGSSAGAAAPSALAGPQTWGVPAGFDTHGFLRAAKGNFITLQEAWDHNDISTLRSMMTDEMLTEIKQQLAERPSHTGGAANTTEVPVLNAQLLGVEELDGGYMASVEFSGMIREDESAGPAPFREVWNMTKPKDGSSGWLVAGLQALH
jgi:predicted lipid-binding transport protein (Tim44 family)